MSTPEQQVTVLTEKLNALELESRRILRALHWATKVRFILFCGLMLFALSSAFLFFRLCQDIKTNRIVEVQRLIQEQPEKLSQSLTRQIMLLAEEEGPFLAEVFRGQAQIDSPQYVEAFDRERAVLIANLQTRLEEKLAIAYESMLDEQEEMLKGEFPMLEDREKMEKVRKNLTRIYDQIGKRYFVDNLNEEINDLFASIDSFPAAEPKMQNVPLGEQIVAEFLDLVRMMIVYSNEYVMPEEPVKQTQTPSDAATESTEQSSSIDQDSAEAAQENQSVIPPGETATESKNDDGQ